MQEKTLTIEIILREVENALHTGSYYMAITTALTLPDVCAALAAPDGRTSAKKYREWYDKFTNGVFFPLSSDDGYSLRCGVVHQGRMGVAGSTFCRVIFALPNEQNNLFHRNIIYDVLQLDCVTFCQDMLSVVRKWFASASDDAIVNTNLNNLVQFRPEGLFPYMIGVPLIA